MPSLRCSLDVDEVVAAGSQDIVSTRRLISPARTRSLQPSVSAISLSLYLVVLSHQLSVLTYQLSGLNFQSCAICLHYFRCTLPTPVLANCAIGRFLQYDTASANCESSPPPPLYAEPLAAIARRQPADSPPQLCGRAGR